MVAAEPVLSAETDPYLSVPAYLAANPALCLRDRRQIFLSRTGHPDPSHPDCWEWHGYRSTAGGYGQLGRNIKAHRLAYELFVGPIPPGMIVLHRCDNPPCVRPGHLRVGTHKENTNEAVARNRGIGHPPSLTSEQVDLIYRRHTEGVSRRQIAREIGCNPSTVGNILLGRLAYGRR